MNRIAQEHELKCHPEEFRAIMQGEKVHELRQNDRDFRVGDVLLLYEFVPTLGHSGEASGAYIRAGVSYVGDAEKFGAPAGFVTMSIVPYEKHGPDGAYCPDGSRSDRTSRAGQGKYFPEPGSREPLIPKPSEPVWHQPRAGTTHDVVVSCVTKDEKPTGKTHIVGYHTGLTALWEMHLDRDGKLWALDMTPKSGTKAAQREEGGGRPLEAQEAENRYLRKILRDISEGCEFSGVAVGDLPKEVVAERSRALITCAELEKKLEAQSAEFNEEHAKTAGAVAHEWQTKLKEAQHLLAWREQYVCPPKNPTRPRSITSVFLELENLHATTEARGAAMEKLVEEKKGLQQKLGLARTFAKVPQVLRELLGKDEYSLQELWAKVGALQKHWNTTAGASGDALKQSSTDC